MSIIKINFNTNLKNDFYEYCKLNEIEDYEEFIQKCAKDGLSLDKYGIAPFLPKSQIQEVPVEKEVIVEKIITKEIDNTELLDKLEEYKKIIQEKENKIEEQQNKIKEQEDVLEHFKNVTVNRRAKYMKSSNLNDTYLD